jgi:hypothetical protein
MERPSITDTGRLVTLSVHDSRNLSLKEGEVVRGKVEDLITDTTALIRLKNKVIEVETKVPFRKGDEILVRVESRGSEIRLRLIDAGNEKPDAVKVKMAAAMGNLKGERLTAEEFRLLKILLGKFPDAIKTHFPFLVSWDGLLGEIDELSAASLRAGIEASGLFFETKMRLLLSMLEEGASSGQSVIDFDGLIQGDLKGILLALKTCLKDGRFLEYLKENNIGAGSIARAVDKMINNVEYFQFQSKLNDSLHVFIPLIWDKLKDGEIIFKETKKNRSEERTISCMVNLDLAGTGKVSVQLLMNAGYIHGRIISENRDFLEMLRGNLQNLEDQFSTSGLNLGSMTLKHEVKMDFQTALPGRLNIIA